MNQSPSGSGSGGGTCSTKMAVSVADSGGGGGEWISVVVLVDVINLRLVVVEVVLQLIHQVLALVHSPSSAGKKFWYNMVLPMPSRRSPPVWSSCLAVSSLGAAITRFWWTEGADTVLSGVGTGPTEDDGTDLGASRSRS